MASDVTDTRVGQPGTCLPASDADALIRLLVVYVTLYQKNLPDEAKIRR